MLPGVNAASNYRNEQVDLQPGGNTVTVETSSDNPFEDLAGPPIVVTQASGGMSSPDPRMRSKRINAKGVRYVTAGFLPGMGDGEEFEVGLYGPVRKTGQRPQKQPRIKQAVIVGRPARKPIRAGFLPGMGSMDGLGLTPTEEAQLREMNQFQAQVEMKNAELKAKKEAEDAKRSQEAWGAVGKGILEASKGAASVITAKEEAKTARVGSEAQARIAAARAAAAEAAARGQMAEAESRSAVARFASENKGKLITSAVVLVGLGIAAYFLLRKKG